MLKQAERIQRIHELIKRRATGSPLELASRLGISKRQLHNLLDLMKQMGAPIVYSTALCSYHYKYEVAWNMGFSSLKEDAMAKIIADGIFFVNNCPVQFYFTEGAYTC